MRRNRVPFNVLLACTAGRHGLSRRKSSKPEWCPIIVHSTVSVVSCTTGIQRSFDVAGWLFSQRCLGVVDVGARYFACVSAET